jgi:hypothetical protein
MKMNNYFTREVRDTETVHDNNKSARELSRAVGFVGLNCYNTAFSSYGTSLNIRHAGKFVICLLAAFFE